MHALTDPSADDADVVGVSGKTHLTRGELRVRGRGHVESVCVCAFGAVPCTLVATCGWACHRLVLVLRRPILTSLFVVVVWRQCLVDGEWLNDEVRSAFPFPLHGLRPLPVHMSGLCYVSCVWLRSSHDPLVAAWVQVINFVLALIQKENNQLVDAALHTPQRPSAAAAAAATVPDVHVFSTFFWTKLTSSAVYDFERVRRWTQRSGVSDPAVACTRFVWDICRKCAVVAAATEDGDEEGDGDEGDDDFGPALWDDVGRWMCRRSGSWLCRFISAPTGLSPPSTSLTTKSCTTTRRWRCCRGASRCVSCPGVVHLPSGACVAQSGAVTLQVSRPSPAGMRVSGCVSAFGDVDSRRTASSVRRSGL